MAFNSSKFESFGASSNVPPEIDTVHEGNPEKITPTHIDQLASVFHENWRASRAKDDGTFETRIKPTKDIEWLRARGIDKPEGQIDIANTTYSELPREWQSENKSAAIAALEIVRSAAVSGKPLNLEDLAAHAHVKWLERNGAWAPDHQKVPYTELSENDKEEDRKQIRAAMEVLGV